MIIRLSIEIITNEIGLNRGYAYACVVLSERIVERRREIGARVRIKKKKRKKRKKAGKIATRTRMMQMVPRSRDKTLVGINHTVRS